MYTFFNERSHIDDFKYYIRGTTMHRHRTISFDKKLTISSSTPPFLFSRGSLHQHMVSGRAGPMERLGGKNDSIRKWYQQVWSWLCSTGKFTQIILTNLFELCPQFFGQDLLLHGEIQSSLDPEHPFIVLVLWKPPQSLSYIWVLVNCVITVQTWWKNHGVLNLQKKIRQQWHVQLCFKTQHKPQQWAYPICWSRTCCSTTCGSPAWACLSRLYIMTLGGDENESNY